MSNEGGYGHRYPGIGIIAFVTDVMSTKITTKNFNCSRFGGSFSPGLGWMCVSFTFAPIVVHIYWQYFIDLILLHAQPNKIG